MEKRDSDGMSAEMSSPSSASHAVPLSSSASTAQTSVELSSPTTFNSFNQDIKMGPETQGEQDDFLGVVSRWGTKEEGGGRADGVGLSKSTFGPPSARPPPGPPPSAPPPLPPVDASGSRPPRNTISPFRRTTSGAASPPLPPPSGALPALPTAPPPSTPTKAESTYSHSRKSSHRRSATPPPRSSSLLSPAQLVESDSAGPSSLSLSIPSTSNGSSSTSSSSPLRSSGARPPRTPSRHLLQSALDLAQRAVEMDKSNNVVGALEAYREAVSRLKSVMERVGVEPGKDDGRKKRSANGKAEEEGRTLKGIHDAYVARIQLLISYETGDQPPSSGEPSPDSFLATTHPSTSTATLVPKSPPDAQAGESTPRPSLDDTTREFGELALNANDDTIRPRALASPFASSRSTEPISEDMPSMQRMAGGVAVPPRGASQGMGNADSSPTSAQSHDAMSPASSTRSRSSRRNPARPSVGLENELDLQISEGDEDMEVLEKTPQLGSSSRMTSVDSDLPSPRRIPDSFDTDRPLPPLPSSASAKSTSSLDGQPKIHARQASLGSMLVSPSTALGTISQRRQKGVMDPPATGQDLQQVAGIDGLPSGGAAFPSRTASNGQPSGLSSIFPPRLRTRSQPGRAGAGEVPPLPTPTIRHKGSFGSHHKPSMASISRAFKMSSEGSRLDASSLAPPPSSSPLSSSSAARSLGPPSVASASGSLMSPLPESQPNELIHRPFHLLRLLQRSMDPNSYGSYLSAKIHISSAVWKPAIWPKTSSGVKALGPPKIAGQEAKVRIMESLITQIGIISRTGLALLDGPRVFRPDGSEGLVDPNLSQTMSLIADELCTALDALEEEMDASHKLLTKSGVTVGAWKGKKSGSAKSWGSKFSKTMDKITNNKAVESPDRYVDLLHNFCAHIQVISDHLSNIVGPCTQNYSSLSDRSFNELKARLLRSSDFVSIVVVPWLLDDFKQFFLRYLKGGVRYMEE